MSGKYFQLFYQILNCEPKWRILVIVRKLHGATLLIVDRSNSFNRFCPRVCNWNNLRFKKSSTVCFCRLFLRQVASKITWNVIATITLQPSFSKVYFLDDKLVFTLIGAILEINFYIVCITLLFKLKNICCLWHLF